MADGQRTGRDRGHSGEGIDAGERQVAGAGLDEGTRTRDEVGDGERVGSVDHQRGVVDDRSGTEDAGRAAGADLQCAVRDRGRTSISVGAGEDDGAGTYLFEASSRITTADDARDDQGAAGTGAQVKVIGDLFVVGDISGVGSSGGPGLEPDGLRVTLGGGDESIVEGDAVDQLEHPGVIEGDHACGEGVTVTDDNRAASRVDGDAAGEGVGGVEQQRTSRCLGEAARAVQGADIAERAGLGVEGDRIGGVTDREAVEVEGAAVQRHRSDAGARATQGRADVHRTAVDVELTFAGGGEHEGAGAGVAEGGRAAELDVAAADDDAVERGSRAFREGHVEVQDVQRTGREQQVVGIRRRLGAERSGVGVDGDVGFVPGEVDDVVSGIAGPEGSGRTKREVSTARAGTVTETDRAAGSGEGDEAGIAVGHA